MPGTEQGVEKYVHQLEKAKKDLKIARNKAKESHRLKNRQIIF